MRMYCAHIIDNYETRSVVEKTGGNSLFLSLEWVRTLWKRIFFLHSCHPSLCDRCRSCSMRTLKATRVQKIACF